MDLRLAGKRALVTGSSSGIGEAIARLLAKEGVSVVIHGRDEERTTQVAASIVATGGAAEAVTGDLTRDEDAVRLGDQVIAGGAIDILVNNAGGYEHSNWMDATPAQWAKTYEANVISGVRMIQRLLPSMRDRGWGRIIQISGGLGQQPVAQQPDYNATLAARSNMAVSLARELAGSGVTSNVVAPGAILVPSLKRFFTSIAPSRGWGESWEAIEAAAARDLVRNDVGRLGQPEEIAWAVAYLASPRADYVTGTVLRVDGGSNRSVY